MSNLLRQSPAGNLRSAAPGFARVLAWLAASAAMSVVLGGIALALAQQGLLPTFVFPILFPLVLGSLVGGLCAAIARRSGVHSVRAVLVVAAACAVLNLAAQEGFAYRTYRQQYEVILASNPRFELAERGGARLGPATFSQFARSRVERNSLYWTVDALLTLAAALAMGWAFSQREGSPAGAASATGASPPATTPTQP